VPKIPALPVHVELWPGNGAAISPGPAIQKIAARARGETLTRLIDQTCQKLASKEAAA